MNDLYILTNPLNTMNKIVIDIKDIVNYIYCPQYYEFYNTKEDPTMTQLYNECIHSTFYAYLLSLQNDTLDDTVGFLKYNWGKQWIKHKTSKDLLLSHVRENTTYRNNYDARRKRGIDAILKFNKIMLNDKQFPIIINHKYEIEILPNIVLTGTLEYVRELTIGEHKVIQVIKFLSENNRFDTNIEHQYNLELIAMSYAFQTLFDVQEFQTIIIDIEKEKIYINYYSNKDYNYLKNTIKNTVISIQNNLKIVSPNKQCFHCGYRNKCLQTFEGGQIC